MGNAPGKNCGNTNLTHDCCGMIGYQEICGPIETCVAQETAESIRLECQPQWGYVALIVLLVVGALFACYKLYKYYDWKKEADYLKKAPEFEVNKLLDDSFKF